MTPSGVDDRIVTEWLARAADDEQNARVILRDRDGTPALVCALSQQVVEKTLKAALIYYTGDLVKSHNLRELAELLRGYLPSLLPEHAGTLERLNEYYISARYPADLPLESFTWKRAEEAFAAAGEVTTVIRKALGKT